jgi:hypothetical protein
VRLASDEPPAAGYDSSQAVRLDLLKCGSRCTAGHAELSGERLLAREPATCWDHAGRDAPPKLVGYLVVAGLTTHRSADLLGRI